MHTEPGRPGRPRSEQARTAVLHAVDDLLVETGYAAMTMKGIAERAGVGRQTVYRWWSSKAEILLEAVRYDARGDLAVDLTGDAAVDLLAYLQALVDFLEHSAAGAAYRALLGEAQHDPAVARLVAQDDVLFETAETALRHAVSQRRAADPAAVRGVAAMLVGPVVLWVLAGRDAAELPSAAIVTGCLAALAAAPTR